MVSGWEGTVNEKYLGWKSDQPVNIRNNSMHLKIVPLTFWISTGNLDI